MYLSAARSDSQIGQPDQEDFRRMAQKFETYTRVGAGVLGGFLALTSYGLFRLAAKYGKKDRYNIAAVEVGSWAVGTSVTSVLALGYALIPRKKDQGISG